MKCPNCKALLPAPDSASCPACGLSLAAAELLLGIAPTLTAPVADMAGVFSDSARRRIELLSHRIRERLPQVRVAVVTTDQAPAELPLSVYAFWLLNRSGICSAVERGGANHFVLLVIQVAEESGKAGRAACMIGYGLEPHVPDDALADSLSAASSDLVRGNWEAAAISFFSHLEPKLIAAGRDTSGTDHGTEEIGQDEEPAIPAADETVAAPASP